MKAKTEIPDRINRVCVMGLGYVGLPTAALLASRGFHVIGVDSSAERRVRIRDGTLAIVEPELDGLLRHAVASGALQISAAPERADVFLIAVPTPLDAEKRADLRFVEGALNAVAPHLERGNCVIVESTSPVGTTARMAKILADARPDLSFPDQGAPDRRAEVAMAYCPERVLPGRIVRELVENDRAIGGLTPHCAQSASAFYRRFVQGALVITDAATAELGKLAENAFRDVNIAFANELANLCARLDVDPWELVQLANRHPRVNILDPGPGVGGHCVAVDPWFLVESAPARDTPLIQAARAVNEERPERILRLILKRAHERASGSLFPPLAILGLSFKADVDDMRESPALRITEWLADSPFAEIIVVEPHIGTLPQSLARPHIRMGTLDEALAGDGLVALLTPHSAFQRAGIALRNHGGLIDACGMLPRRRADWQGAARRLLRAGGPL